MRLMSMAEIRVDPYPALTAFLVARYREELLILRHRVSVASRRAGKATAKRQIRSLVGRLKVVESWAAWLESDAGAAADFSAHFLAEQTLRQLVFEYVDHPDYRQEWRP
jgi:hypothetical protein